ncbi:MAG: hypothetical protein AAGD96_13835 [Chloroflexota bacterium]
MNDVFRLIAQFLIFFLTGTLTVLSINTREFALIPVWLIAGVGFFMLAKRFPIAILFFSLIAWVPLFVYRGPQLEAAFPILALMLIVSFFVFGNGIYVGGAYNNYRDLRKDQNENADIKLQRIREEQSVWLDSPNPFSKSSRHRNSNR